MCSPTDVFLDGHPPFWRFQLEGRDNVGEWYRSYAPDGVATTVITVVPTATGFVTEFLGEHTEAGELLCDRKVLLCQVRGSQISALTIYCSGDWDAGAAHPSHGRGDPPSPLTHALLPGRSAGGAAAARVRRGRSDRGS